MPIIEVEHLIKRYSGTVSGSAGFTAVDDLSFSVEPGELFGFLGPNGAGKTTTISVLCTLLAPTGGSAQVAGFDCVRESRQVREQIGIIFQDPSLDERLTAWENLRFHAMIYHIPPRERRTRIESVLEMVDLADRRNSIVKKFSGGMKRRLEIARGLLHRPKVLFLDEPTIGLDPQTRRKMWEFVHSLRSNHQITLFLTTHYMEEAEACDRVLIIDHGKLVALGAPQELKARYSSPEATLEDIFIQLTGHEIREEPAGSRDVTRTLRRWSRNLR
ncbi:MAG: ATP-binding cassette domain-containing protein [Candidatus Omnitrophica bacterium]|nr:ATP-binding cassette domain-containing protein [Candidatus Omnitrophota bacterium]